jgi:hypothetical protein
MKGPKLGQIANRKWILVFDFQHRMTGKKNLTCRRVHHSGQAAHKVLLPHRTRQ